MHIDIFVNSIHWVFSFQFSPYFREKTFWWAWRKNIRTLLILFPLLPPTKYLQKIFSPNFFLFYFSSSLNLEGSSSQKKKKKKSKHNSVLPQWNVGCILLMLDDTWIYPSLLIGLGRFRSMMKWNKREVNCVVFEMNLNYYYYHFLYDNFFLRR